MESEKMQASEDEKHDFALHLKSKFSSKQSPGLGKQTTFSNPSQAEEHGNKDDKKIDMGISSNMGQNSSPEERLLKIQASPIALLGTPVPLPMSDFKLSFDSSPAPSCPMQSEISETKPFCEDGSIHGSSGPVSCSKISLHSETPKAVRRSSESETFRTSYLGFTMSAGETSPQAENTCKVAKVGETRREAFSRLASASETTGTNSSSHAGTPVLGDRLKRSRPSPTPQNVPENDIDLKDYMHDLLAAMQTIVQSQFEAYNTIQLEASELVEESERSLKILEEKVSLQERRLTEMQSILMNR